MIVIDCESVEQEIALANVIGEIEITTTVQVWTGVYSIEGKLEFEVK